ncbi:hypothetical protein JHK87_029364 [Glycine soja]|nr:hypothetical protein JHK87_029364 [Glycine soja]
MVTWPIFAEQFFNEKFLVDVLRIGVSVGAKEWKSLNEFGSEVVKREDIGKTIALLMGGGEESVEMRRVKALSDTAKKAIQPVGYYDYGEYDAPPSPRLSDVTFGEGPASHCMQDAMQQQKGRKKDLTPQPKSAKHST